MNINELGEDLEQYIAIINLEYESDAVKKQVEEKIKYHRRSLRNAIGYNTKKNVAHSILSATFLCI